VGLTREQAERYARQLKMPEIGAAGQEKLLAAIVLVVGAGGLGSAALTYLAAAGVSNLVLVDGDRVELSNLNRQILHGEADIGRLKVESARDALALINPEVRVEVRAESVTEENVREMIRDCDVVLDCLDNFPTRFLLNDACFREQKPLVSGAVRAFEGQLFTLLPGTDAGCYRCLLAEEPPPPDGLILGATAGFIGTLQALEAVKIITGCGEPLAEEILVGDALHMRFRKLRRRRDPSCPLCGDRPETGGPGGR